MIENQKDLLDVAVKALEQARKAHSASERRGQFVLIGVSTFGQLLERETSKENQIGFLASLREALVKRMAVDLLESDLNDRTFLVIERFGRGYLSAALSNYNSSERTLSEFYAFSEEITAALGI